jgi:hypothetical protein
MNNYQINLKKAQSQVNERCLKRMKKSIVFIDNNFTEWFNLTIGIENIIKTGNAFNLREFNSLQV